ncbi:MAG: type IX secretion system membrane protein PorP/SprF [Elusimicrobia bacterium]|nr:type IX secretion system membrane protein PorP/SprF [Elusimicrobiota bacterium]
MKKNTLTLSALALTAALCLPPAARAAYEDLGTSPRAVGMGNAFTAVADDGYAIYYNPAGLATLTRPEMSASYARLLMGLSDNSNISNSFMTYAHPIKDGQYGTAAVALNYFSLQGLYHETSFFGAYSHSLFETYIPNQLYGGLSLKVLNRKVNASAADPIDNTGQVVVGGVDPALTNAAATNLGVDWGLLYRPRPRWSLGLMVQHFLEPNIAFNKGDTDRLGRNIKLGAAYLSPWSTLALDLGLPSAPDGSLDKTVALAAEKWLPTLLYGTIGFRGSLAAGTRDFRQLGVGVSYKIFRMQFDYGFNIPLGGLATSGSHRFGLTYRFGYAKARPATVSEAILENMQEFAEAGSPEFRYQMEELTAFKRTAIDEFLRQAKLDVSAGKFADAYAKVNEVVALKPGDARIAESAARLKLVSDIYPEVRQFTDEAAQAAVYDGSLKFLAGKDQDALVDLASAQRLHPDGRTEALMAAIETKAGLKRGEAAAAAPAPSPEDALAAHKRQLIEGYMALMEVSLRQFEYDKVIKLAKQVTELDDTNVLAYKRMGAAYHAQQRYPEALTSLLKAFEHETDSDGRKNLRSYIMALQSLIKRGQEAATAAKPPVTAPRPPASPASVERLYEQGVEFYSRGQLKESADCFRRILESDPNDKSARQALRRVEAESLQSGESR